MKTVIYRTGVGLFLTGILILLVYGAYELFLFDRVIGFAVGCILLGIIFAGLTVPPKNPQRKIYR